MKKGFTLIEALMVVLIIGIFAMAAMPGFVNTYNAIKIEGAYKQLIQDIRYAKQLAINLELTHGILFDCAQNSYSIYRQTSANIVNDPTTQRPLTVTYASGKFSGVTIANTTFNLPAQDTLEFDSFGVPSCGGTITLSYSGITKTITVEANTGRVI